MDLLFVGASRFGLRCLEQATQVPSIWISSIAGSERRFVLILVPFTIWCTAPCPTREIKLNPGTVNRRRDGSYDVLCDSSTIELREAIYAGIN